MPYAFRRLLLAKRLADHPITDIRRRLELLRLRYTARYRQTTTRLLGPALTIADAPAFLFTFHEIFQQEVYRFVSRNPRPIIIDGGANIGLSAIYFRKLYPQSHIIAFEPDPDHFALLRKNLRAFGYHDIETRNEALWVQAGEHSFLRDGAEAGRLARFSDQATQKVSCVRLKEHLKHPVDMLKLDIEGAETDVLLDCRDALTNVAHIFVEYHSFAHEKQRIQELLGTLIDAGFRLQMLPARSLSQPFIRRDLLLGMDLQLNIFGYRDQSQPN